jgi:hypothetical protein
MYKRIPEYQNNIWGFREFETQKDYIAFLKSKLKKVGDYNLYDTDIFVKTRSNYQKHKTYTDKVYKSKDWIEFWDFEKLKSKQGVIINDFYLTAHYYFYLNFCPIINVLTQSIEFPEVWDSHYDYTLHAELAKVTGRHVAVLKKRRWGFSFLEVADMYRLFIFEERKILKFIHKDDDPNNKNYRMFNDYRIFIDKNTAWIRPVMGDSKGLYQRVEQVDLVSKKKTYIGTSSFLELVSTKQKASQGVGGFLTKGFFDEAGTNNHLIKSIQYNEKSIKQGGVVNGQLIIGGSVGELKDSEDLKNIIYNPKSYGFYSIFNDTLNLETGLFYPESVNYVEALYDEEDDTIQIGSKKYYDKDGNSDIDGAVKAIANNRKRSKQKSPEAYRLTVSQEPLTIDEAFNERIENIFPTHLIQPRYDKLVLVKDKILNCCELNKVDGKIISTWVDTKRKIVDLPIKKDTDLRGCCVIYEHPIKDPPIGLYYAGIDTVSKKNANRNTTTSLMTCYIIKAENLINGELTKREIVAEYCGRYEDYEKTYTQVMNLCYYYNARMLIENNVGDFITWALQNKQSYKGVSFKMIQNTEMTNIKDIVVGFSAQADFGVNMSSQKLKSYLNDLIISYLENPINKIFDENTGESKNILGIDKFPDFMGLLEMLKFNANLNVDRLSVLGLALWAEQILCMKNNFVIKTDTQKKEMIKPQRTQFHNFNRIGKTNYY